jgi:hypothetical protein
MSQARDLWTAFVLLIAGGFAIVTIGFAGLLLAAPATILAGLLTIRGSLESQALFQLDRLSVVFFSRRVSAREKRETLNAWQSLLWKMVMPTQTPFLLLIPGVFLPEGLALNIVRATLGELLVIMIFCMMYGFARIVSIQLFFLSRRGREQMTRETERKGDVQS